VVLFARQGKLTDLSSKIGHHSAAASSLLVEIRYVGDRHVTGELESVVPVRVGAEDAGSKMQLVSFDTLAFSHNRYFSFSPSAFHATLT